MTRQLKGAGWVDGSVPDLSDVLTPALGIEPAEFAAWLSPRLGYYRAANSDRSLPRARLIAAMRAADSAIENVCTTLDELPDDVADSIANTRLGAAIDLPELTARLKRDLLLLSTMLSRAEADASETGSQRGRKTDAARDRLLAEIFDKLRARGHKVDVANSLTEKILIRCRVPVPESDRKLRDAINRGRKLL